MVYTKTIESLEEIEKRITETVKRNQKEVRNTLVQSHEETTEILKKSHKKYSIFSLHLHRKKQEALDKLQNLTSTMVVSQVLSREIQSVVDTIVATDKESGLFEKEEVERLRSFLEFKASALNTLQETVFQKLSVLQEMESEQIRNIPEIFTSSLKKLPKTNTLFDIPGIRHSI